VSVVVTASGDPAEFRLCLASLRATLGARDEVACVVPAHRFDLFHELRDRPWLTVLDGEAGDQATRWATGIAATKHPVVVLLDGDVFVSAHWLDLVGAAFAAADVVAAGPRCHLSFGPQGIDLPADAVTSTPRFAEYARLRRQAHVGLVTEVDRLGPVCVAVRRDALAEAGGPTADLPYEALAALGRMVVVDRALVAHLASPRCSLRASTSPPTRPFLTGCLIVKDEEELLSGCLAALGEFVDETVVYDTGSADRTREIARGFGAQVIAGYWNDHFGDARNRASAHCRGDWIFSVDADEIVTGDPAGLRALLSSAVDPVMLVRQENAYGHGESLGASTVLYPRLFRTDRARYAGRLHEQIVDRITGQRLTGPLQDTVVLAHSGYTESRSAAKGKRLRNLRLAEMDATGRPDLPAIVNLARSQLWNGGTDDAIETCRNGLAATQPAAGRAILLAVLVEALTRSARFEEAEAALGELRAVSGSSFTPGELEARLRFAEGDFARTLTIVRGLAATAVDDTSTVVSRQRLVGLEILSMFRAGDSVGAARLLEQCVGDGHLPLTVAQMADVLAGAGVRVAELAALLPPRRLRALLLSAAQAPDGVADELLEALWVRYAGDTTVLAVAAKVGGRRPVIRALEWSARLRQHGLADHCTLLALAADLARTPRERSLAAAVALELFNDENALPPLAAALDDVSEPDNAGVLAELRTLAPGVASAIEPVPASQ
jgi:hypothetical protein